MNVLIAGARPANRVIPGGPLDPAKPMKKLPPGMFLGMVVPVEHERVQALRILKNGSTAAVANQLQQQTSRSMIRGTGIGNSHANLVSVTETTLEFNANSAVAAGLFESGFLTLIDSIGPEVYLIANNDVSGSSAPFRTRLYLDEPIRRDLTAAGTSLRIVSSPFANCVVATGSSADSAGVPQSGIGPNEYYAALIKGYQSLEFPTGVSSAAATHKQITKVSGGVGILSSHGGEAIGHLVGNQTVADDAWGLCYIDLT